MKKISITIPSPCHENWNEMTPKEQGRFCSSCQKTVVDFSLMSDRQIAEFFRKPSSSTCGRFHRDQIGREIVIPKKSIPWAQYLFKATWPAFVLFLKSCTDRQNVMGIAITAPPQPHDGELLKQPNGMILSKITPVDSTKEFRKELNNIEVVTTHTVGLIAPPPQHITGDTVYNMAAPVEEILPTKESCFPLDTVTIAGYSTCKKPAFVSGAISVNSTKEVAKDVINKKTLENADFNVNVYPNPVKAGGRITIVCTSNEAIRQIQLVAASGADIPLINNLVAADAPISVTIPSSLPSGAYYLRVLTDNQRAKTVKLILLN